MDPGDVALIALLVCVPASIVVFNWWTWRSMQYYATDGALAEAYPVHDADGVPPFELALPEGPPLWVMMRYTVERSRRGGGRSTYGVTVEVDAERAPDIVVQQQHTMGGDARKQGDFPVAPAEMFYLNKKRGVLDERTAVMARLPAGGAGTVRFRVHTGVGTTIVNLCVFAKPPPDQRK